MKRLIMTVCCLSLLLLTACGGTKEPPASLSPEPPAVSAAESEESSMTEKNPLTLSDTKIQITWNGRTAVFQLYDTTAARELCAQLPMTLDTTNFRDAQWMFYPPEKLNVTQEEAYHDGKRGELSYYEPWGDVFILYEDFYAGDEMHRLGVCVEGIGYLAEMSGTVTVKMAGGESSAEPAPAPEERAFRDVAYDTQSQAQKLDLFLPETGDGPFPLVVFIHGGGWFSGDKSDGQENAWVGLTKYGYAAASLNYRLSGEAPHPAGIVDCKTAIRWLKAHAGEYALDAERVAVAGDSSGGHYALLAALTSGNPDFEDLSRGNEQVDSSVNCAVVWYPATDLAETMRTIQNGEYTGFGADFAWNNIERYTGLSYSEAAALDFAAVSPITYITLEMPPVLLQHGDADTICPIDQSQRFCRRAVEIAGEDKVRLTVLPGAGHGDMAFETEENMEIVREFLEENLK